jgi:hypothetical protein
MKHVIVLLALLFGGIVMPAGVPAIAAELGAMRPVYGQGHASVLPFPRSTRAQAVWGEGACWRDCQRTCTWGLAGCLTIDAQGRCLKYTDACDRSCQRQCRVRGGPYLTIGD